MVVVVVCAGTEKGSRVGSWNTGGSEKREKEEGSRVKGEVEGSRHADPPEAPHNPGGRFK